MEGLGFDPLPSKVVAARTLTGRRSSASKVSMSYSEVARKDREKPVTVIELTLDRPVESGRILGEAHAPKSHFSELGALLSENARLEISSTCGWDNPGNHARLFVGDKVDFAFHTDKEKNPWAKLDLGAVKTVRNIVIENRANERRTDGLILSISHDGQKWEEYGGPRLETTWVVPVTHVDAGHDIPGP